MQVHHNTIVSLRYTMRNEAGDLMEDNTGREAISYVHGSGNLLPALEQEMSGLSAGDAKTFTIRDELLKGAFRFEVFVDAVRAATPEEIAAGLPAKPAATEECGPDCIC